MKLNKIFILVLILLSCSKQGHDFEVSPSSIVGGELVSKGEYSGVVALVRSGDIICSGVALDPFTVLTAAHCVSDQYRYSLKVYVGNGKKLPNPNTYIKTDHLISKILIHPSVQIKDGIGITNLGEYNVNDIAIIKLFKPLKDIQFYKIHSSLKSLKRTLNRGHRLAIVGFGYTGEDFSFDDEGERVEYGRKRVVEVPIVKFNHHELDVREAGKDSCFTDSGGPAFVKNGNQLEILGLVSRSDGLCGEDEFPVYYSLVLDSACWINKVAGIEVDDLEFHCNRNLDIIEFCQGLTGREARQCYSTRSLEIFLNEFSL